MNCCDESVIVQPGQVIVFEHEGYCEPIVLEHAEQGPPGVPGPPGPDGGSVLQRTAGVTLPALRVVYEGAGGNVYLLDYRDTDNIFRILGVTVTAADAGAAINVQRFGNLDDDFFSFTPGNRIFVGEAGALTQVAPDDGFLVPVGAAIDVNRILLGIESPIFMG